MVKVITYGTFDMLHRGHIRLLERAKALGDYLIVGVTSDDYDRFRGKINIQQSLIERVEAVRATGLADEIIVEEYEGQKIDDVQRLNVDVFVLGSDWEGRFDYLRAYCQVVYLPRTEGISSSEIRTERRKLRLGIIGYTGYTAKIVSEAAFVNGIEIVGIYDRHSVMDPSLDNLWRADSAEALLAASDAVYVLSEPERHEEDVRLALNCGKHVLCESPIALSRTGCESLFALAKQKHCILMDGIKTAYSTAFDRLVLLAKSGKIGKVLSVDAVCTSMRGMEQGLQPYHWNTICAWGPTAMLPIFQIIGCDYIQKNISTAYLDPKCRFDGFTKIDFQYRDAVASLKVAQAAKAEGELVVTGTKGYIYVPAPWWKTDYFEVRFEESANNQRFFYQLDGEGIRYELVAFSKAVERSKPENHVKEAISFAISSVISDYYNKTDTFVLENV